MKVTIDENLPRELADLFREAGHDGVTVGDEGLGGRSDGAIGAQVRREERALVTLDVGFGDIRAYRPERFGDRVARLTGAV